MQIQSQKSDDKENIQKVETAHQTRNQRKQNPAKRTVTQKRNNKEDSAALRQQMSNVVVATNLVDQTKKTKNQREVKTAHQTRYQQSINHMPGTDHKRRVMCKMEGCNLASSYYCVACGVHLCIKSDEENAQKITAS